MTDLKKEMEFNIKYEYSLKSILAQGESMRFIGYINLLLYHTKYNNNLLPTHIKVKEINVYRVYYS